MNDFDEFFSKIEKKITEQDILRSSGKTYKQIEENLAIHKKFLRGYKFKKLINENKNYIFFLVTISILTLLYFTSLASFANSNASMNYVTPINTNCISWSKLKLSKEQERNTNRYIQHYNSYKQRLKRKLSNKQNILNNFCKEEMLIASDVVTLESLNEEINELQQNIRIVDKELSMNIRFIVDEQQTHKLFKQINSCDKI